jgi:hypothetical protein
MRWTLGCYILFGVVLVAFGCQDEALNDAALLVVPGAGLILFGAGGLLVSIACKRNP